MNCLECRLFTGEYEDTHNGFLIIFCDNGKIHATTLEAGCESFQPDCVLQPCEVVS